VEGDLGGGKGFPVDAALGTIDALEWSGSSRASMIPLFHAWNNDLRIAPVGGEDSISNLHWTKLVGSVRTYAQTGAERSIPAWLEALRRGRTYMSTGPLLEFWIEDQMPGGELKLSQPRTLQFKARATSIAPLTKVVIYRNGVAWKEVTSGSLEERVQVDESGWYALYAEGKPYTWLDAEYPQALTNAIRVYVGDQKVRSRASAEYFTRWITKLQGMAEKWPWWRSEKEKQHVFAQFAEAIKLYQSLASEAGR